MKTILFFLNYIFQYTFYRLYRFGILFNIPFKKLNKRFNYNVEFHVAHWSTAALTLLIMLNITTFITFLFSNILNLYSKTRIIWIIMFLLMHIINCLYFLKRKKYLKIAERFSNETIIGKILSTLFLFIIIFLTIILGNS